MITIICSECFTTLKPLEPLHKVYTCNNLLCKSALKPIFVGVNCIGFDTLEELKEFPIEQYESAIDLVSGRFVREFNEAKEK